MKVLQEFRLTGETRKISLDEAINILYGLEDGQLELHEEFNLIFVKEQGDGD